MEQKLCNNAPTRSEVKCAIKDAKKKLLKAAGPDGIMNWMIVWGGDLMIDLMYHLFVSLWESSIVPTVWGACTGYISLQG